MGKIIAVCISEKRGTPKQNIGECRAIVNWGFEGDAHAGNWHRQVSFLDTERIADFFGSDSSDNYGVFGENLVISGLEFSNLEIGTHLICGDSELEITQFGKECHGKCAIFKRSGKCIMPEYGVFSRVISGGKISVGDEIFVKEVVK